MKLLHQLMVVGALAVPAPGAQAQSYPNKLLRLVCPFPPGGAMDIASRAVAHQLPQMLGQPVAVENRPGAGGYARSPIAQGCAFHPCAIGDPRGRLFVRATSQLCNNEARNLPRHV